MSSSPRQLASTKAASVVLALAWSAAASAQSPPNELRLNRARFAASIDWRVPDGRQGRGRAVHLSDDTGYFWFFTADNVEVAIKVLDGRRINGHFWVFFAGLSSVEYTLTVTDTSSGDNRRYFNAFGTQASVGDTTAFPPSASARAPLSWPNPPRADAPALGLDGRHGEEPGGGGGGTVALSYAACHDGSANVYPCRRIDLRSLMPLADLGSPDGTGSDIWGWTDPKSGREVALVTLSDATAFVDVSAPEAPRLLGRLPTATIASPWRDVKTYADHAYVVADRTERHGLQVLDLRQLPAVGAPPVTFTPTARYTRFGSAHNIAINEETGFAYVVGSDSCAGGLHMVDLAEPAAPRFAGCFADDGYTHDVQCVVFRGADAAYRGREICFASNEDSLTVVDVSDKGAPRQLSRTDYAGRAYAHQGWLTEDHRSFLLDDEGDERELDHATRTYIWDVADLDAPQVIGVHTGSSTAIDHNLYTHRGLAFAANYTSGLRILDLTAVASGRLEEIAFFDVVPAHDDRLFDGAWSVYPYFTSGNVVVSAVGQGLFVLQPLLPGFADPTPPTELRIEVVDLQAELSWQLDGSRRSGLRIYRRVGDGPRRLQAELAAASTRYVDPNLVAETTYDYQVVAWNALGESAPAAASVTTPALPRQCVAGATTLCLNDERFLVEVEWRGVESVAGPGFAHRLTADSGTFWFFRESNVELVVKLLDGRRLNGNYWLFYGALSNVEYTLRVIDTASGRLRVYTNPAGRFASVGDVTAFPGG